MTPPTWIMRLLGLRMLVQGILQLTRARRTTFAVCAAVDLTHAATMLVAAQVWPRYRRAALLSAAGAGLSAVVGVTAASTLAPST